MSNLPQPDRRRFLLNSLTLIPAVSLTPGLIGAAEAEAKQVLDVKHGSTSTGSYNPTFFKPDEWSFIHAACARLIPQDDSGLGAVEAGVPEFLDRHMQTPYANGSIWYMQGPFLEASKDFGYQGRKTLSEIIRSGIRSVINWTESNKKSSFESLDAAVQDEVLHLLEKGDIKLNDIDSKTFFDYFLGEVRNGFFADPSHGGNKNMVGWKLIGYPGMRADFADFITVRDKPYPLGPVDLAGNRG